MTSYRQPGTTVTERTFAVPLDHVKPDGEQIEIFAREVVATAKADANLPWLVFLQGGPGFGAPRPVGRDSWLARALDDYRVLLVDQRGTARSSPVTGRKLARLGGARAQARYLSLFRADSIVLDAELIRREVTGGEPWSVLGQSFGGFCAVSYLSFAPHGLTEAFITGGLPGLTAHADDVYRLTYPRVAAKNAAWYERYPGDIEHVRNIARYLAEHAVMLPDGGLLTVEAFQSAGILLGQKNGAHQLHYLLEGAFDEDELADAFRYGLQSMMSYAGHPLYALLHEACYAQGGATRWSAQRVRAEFPAFDAIAALGGDDQVLLTGEMVYPWTIDADPVLRPFREAADLLAERGDWPPLYDPSRLAANEVPVAAAIYYDDMYVPRDLSVATAGAIRGLQPWITSEHEHDALRVSSGKVLDRLISAVRGTV